MLNNSVEEIMEKYSQLKNSGYYTEAFLHLYYKLEFLLKEGIKNNQGLEDYLKIKEKIEKSFKKNRKNTEEFLVINDIFQKDIIDIVKSSFEKINVKEKELRLNNIKDLFSKNKIEYNSNAVEKIFKSEDKSLKNQSARNLRNHLVHNGGEEISREVLEKYESNMREILEYVKEVGITIKRKWEQ